MSHVSPKDGRVRVESGTAPANQESVRSVHRSVIKADARMLMGSLLAGLTVRRFDAAGVAGKYGIRLVGDVPESARFMGLYKGGVSENINCRGDQAYTFCLGMRRAENDAKKGFVLHDWRWLDSPEKDRPDAYNTHVRRTDIVYSHDVTCFGKMHLVFSKDKPFLCVNPIQSTHINEDHDVLVAELDGMIEGAGSAGEKHALRGMRKMVNTKRGSPFRYRDRGRVFGLVALEVASSLGVDTIALPYSDVRGNPIVRGDTILQRYREVEDLMSAQKLIRGLNVVDWGEYVAGSI